MRGKIRKILKIDNYEMLETDNGIKGLQIASSNNPDCILLDIIMPGIDGLKILKAQRDRGSKIPIIVVTADIQETTRKRCLDLGAYAVVNKPPKEDELRALIRDALRLKEGVVQ